MSVFGSSDLQCVPYWDQALVTTDLRAYPNLLDNGRFRDATAR
jgi:hypothetical protein